MHEPWFLWLWLFAQPFICIEGFKEGGKMKVGEIHI